MAADVTWASEVSVHLDSRSAGMRGAWNMTLGVTAGSENGVLTVILEVQKQKSRSRREMKPVSTDRRLQRTHSKVLLGGAWHVFIVCLPTVVKSHRSTLMTVGHESLPDDSTLPAWPVLGVQRMGPRATAGGHVRPLMWASEGSSDENQWGTEILKKKKPYKRKNDEFSVENILMKKPN